MLPYEVCPLTVSHTDGVPDTETPGAQLAEQGRDLLDQSTVLTSCSGNRAIPKPQDCTWSRHLGSEPCTWACLRWPAINTLSVTCLVCTVSVVTCARSTPASSRRMLSSSFLVPQNRYMMTIRPLKVNGTLWGTFETAVLKTNRTFYKSVCSGNYYPCKLGPETPCQSGCQL